MNEICNLRQARSSFAVVAFVLCAVVFLQGSKALDGKVGSEEYGLSKKELVEAIEAIEGHISKCMRENGFEYIAVDYDTVRRGMLADKTLPGMPEERFIENNGFGIATMYTGLPPQLSPLQIPAKIGLGEKNVEIFLSLPPKDRTAYNHTLFGKNVHATFAVTLETQELTLTGGCTREAVEQVFSAEELTATYSNPKAVMMDSDPRVIEGTRNYTKCIKDGGFNYDGHVEIKRDIQKRLDGITGHIPITDMSPEKLAALKALQAEEIVLGNLAYQCFDEHLEQVEEIVYEELFPEGE